MKNQGDLELPVMPEELTGCKCGDILTGLYIALFWGFMGVGYFEIKISSFERTLFNTRNILFYKRKIWVTLEVNNIKIM